MKLKRYTDTGFKAATALLLPTALILSFTVSDYYIFNRIGEFNFVFVFSQWVKKAGLLLLPLAVFYKKKSCADIAKYILPPFVILSCILFGKFFDVTMLTGASNADEVYAHINEFIPKAANMALYFIQCALYLAICAYLFVRDGYKVNGKSFIWLPFAFIACMPLNIFENFFDINNIPANSFLRFKNFTLWHFLAILILAGFTIGSYYFLKNKTKEKQHQFLAAAAIVLLIQYHSKDSIVMGDGYNVYRTVFACIPLFICNIGVYVACISVFLKKRVLYAIAFFVHAAGAVSVFVYFGKDEMSNYGIFCSYSILYFCLTHCLLFALSVMPTALGHYKYRHKDCIIPLVYYFAVIILASISSALVSSASMEFTVTTPSGKYTLDGYSGWDDKLCEWLRPNYAFTQINPLPFEVPMWKLTIWRYDLNALYILGLYAAYVGIFYAMNGAYFAFLAIRKKVLKKASEPQIAIRLSTEAASETAVTDEHTTDKTDEEEKV
ncbi:MAG: YwaF family protein [Clostridia bacterium]|nr:YwaF family protein [Clostridia bacterium]